MLYCCVEEGWEVTQEEIEDCDARDFGGNVTVEIVPNNSEDGNEMKRKL